MKISVVAVLLALVAGTAQAQEPEAKISGFVESYNQIVRGEKLNSSLNLYIEGPIKGRLGWATVLWVQKDWTEWMGGFTVTPAPWIEFIAVLGGETDDRPLRGSGILWLSKAGLTLEAEYEAGGSGTWYRANAKYKVHFLSLGVNSVADVGTGPYLELGLGKWDLWGSYVVKAHGGVFGLRRNF
ncbi:MAG TPA: hypothetical protein VJC13_01710 [Candidatus Paceibacterota bacterium]